MGGHRFDHIGDGDDAGLYQYFVPLQAVWVAGPVHPFVVLPDDLRQGPVGLHILEDLISLFRMFLNQGVLGLCQGRRFGQYFGRDGQFPDVMDGGRPEDPVNLLRGEVHLTSDGAGKVCDTDLVPGGVWISRFNGGDDHLDGCLNGPPEFFKGLLAFRDIAGNAEDMRHTIEINHRGRQQPVSKIAVLCPKGGLKADYFPVLS